MKKSVNDRVSVLRSLMQKENLSAYYITGTDPHMSEYVSPRWRTLSFISSFTGSAGSVLITEDKALLWVDSRYYIQGAKEIENSEFTLMKTEEITIEEYMKKSLPEGSVVGIEEKSVSIKSFLSLKEKLSGKKIEVRTTKDLLQPIWTDRPEEPFSILREVNIAYAGLTREEKLERVREELEKSGADFTFISSLDDIAWLTNLRGDDILYNPVFLSFAFVDKKKAILFTSRERFDKELLKKVGECFEVREYEDAYTALPSLKNGRGYYDRAKLNMSFYPFIQDDDILHCDITTTLKARKNMIELRGMRRAHKLDGIAFASFMAELNKVPDGSLTEIDVSNALEEQRKKLDGYIGPSFAPISAFAENGAIVHYSANEESNRRIDKDGLLVLDTGSQFTFGTTDLTRTLLFGKAKKEEKIDYTLVLKGHLALASQRFIKGTRGYQLDILARQYLWTAGMTYSHGTGHGVGCGLSVHEGPARISPAAIDVPLEEGMVLSDEPGVYKENRYGIRIENLIAVEKNVTTEFGEFLSFEVLSLVPYEKALIETKLLTDNEITLINAYHSWVRDELIDEVDDKTKVWLEEATSPLSRE
ncbi:MAG: aminopeptidase P family protein [Spirochaetales bacterium]|nr:aminopeptidase P family protein [Spirochaetales bacterium]